MKIVAIDFETATAKHTSPCSIGIAYRDGATIQCQQHLIKPTPFTFDKRNIAIHGIKPEDVAKAPTFPEVWQDILPLLENSLVIMHNASFDISVLTQTLSLYNIPYPNLEYACTMKLAQALLPDMDCFKLDHLCQQLDVNLSHHHSAICDSQACLLLCEKLLDIMGCCFGSFCEAANIETGLLYHKFSGQDIHQKLSTPFYYTKPKTNPSPSSLPSYAYEHISITEINNIPTIYADEDFVNKYFCITGELLSMSRQRALEIIVKLGGTVTSTVTKKTNYLIVGNSNPDYSSSKVRKALAAIESGQEIEIIDEDEFIKMIDLQAYENFL